MGAIMNQLSFPAHIRFESGNKIVQSVEDHCESTAQYASKSLESIGLANTGHFLGLTHDCGKMTDSFTQYIEKAASGEEVKRGSVNHTFAPVKYILNHYHASDDVFQSVTAELFAYAIGAHHGPFDCIGPDHVNGFVHRLDSEDNLYKEAISNFQKFRSTRELDELFESSLAEMRPILERLVSLGKNGTELCFYFGCMARLLLSAVVDADRRDTSEFMRAIPHSTKSTFSSGVWQQTLRTVEDKLKNLDHSTDIQRARAQFSQMCKDKATCPGGLYTLSLPTGAGKTLTSLRYALAHAAFHSKKRIIFTAPLLSILEQNAKVIREYVQNDDLILEHHSNIVTVKGTKDAVSPAELFIDSWDAPIIITTFVQLLNNMFSGDMAAIRRFNSLSDSVIVIDEIQSLPIKMLSMFHLMVSFLTEVCRATVVLCSATQPAEQEQEHPYATSPKELIPYDKALWDVFKRTDITNAGAMHLDQIPDFIEMQLKNKQSLLTICNRKDEAHFLFDAVRMNPEYNCFHYSSDMCIKHREDTLEQIRASLTDHTKKTVCISTQAMEAGVNISFGGVIRLMAGLDNIVQAAGRCNRHGESDVPAPVYVIRCLNENLAYLQEIKQAKDATVSLLTEFEANRAAFADDLSSAQAVERYYRILYRGLYAGAMDFPTEEHGLLFDLLAQNPKYCTETADDGFGQYFLTQAFKTAGADFSVFDSQSVQVIVPYKKGSDIIKKLRDIGDRFDPAALSAIHDLVQQAKPYTVPVFDYQLDILKKSGCVDCICNDSIWVLQADCFGDIPYDSKTGLVIKKG